MLSPVKISLRENMVRRLKPLMAVEEKCRGCDELYDNGYSREKLRSSRSFGTGSPWFVTFVPKDIIFLCKGNILVRDQCLCLRLLGYRSSNSIPKLLFIHSLTLLNWKTFVRWRTIKRWTWTSFVYREWCVRLEVTNRQITSPMIHGTNSIVSCYDTKGLV